MIQTDHDEDEDNNDVDGNVTEHPRRLGREQAPPKRFEDYEVQADRAYGTKISPRSFLISFVILLYAISYNICI